MFPLLFSLDLSTLVLELQVLAALKKKKKKCICFLVHLHKKGFFWGVNKKFCKMRRKENIKGGKSKSRSLFKVHTYFFWSIQLPNNWQTCYDTWPANCSLYFRKAQFKEILSTYVYFPSFSEKEVSLVPLLIFQKQLALGFRINIFESARAYNSTKWG